MCESGLEQLLLLAESDSAQKEFKGLGNEDDRRDFEDRIRERIARVRNAPRVSRRECAAHFDRAIRKINKDTVKLPEELLVSEVMRGALEPLDDYTTLIWPSSADQFDKHTRGDFIGVGISIFKNRETDEIEVVTPLEDSPAYRAGIQAGDVITHVNDKPLKGFSINRVVKTITGPIGTSVTLTIRRGEDVLDFPLERDKIEIVSVKGLHRRPDDPERWEHWLDRENGIAYIRLTNFQRNTPEALLNLRSVNPFGEPDTEDRMVDGPLGTEVRRAIDGLPLVYRETLVLSDLMDLAYVEIAEETGVPVGTVKSRLFRARRMVQIELGAYALAIGFLPNEQALPDTCRPAAPVRSAARLDDGLQTVH